MAPLKKGKPKEQSRALKVDKEMGNLVSYWDSLVTFGKAAIFNPDYSVPMMAALLICEIILNVMIVHLVSCESIRSYSIS